MAPGEKEGGFIGAICDYEPGQSSWTFSAQEAFIHNNLFEPETACDLFHEGTFPYTIIKIEDKLFLKLNKSELGHLIISEDGNTMQIDQNEHSEGTGADGFFFEFERM